MDETTSLGGGGDVGMTYLSIQSTFMPIQGRTGGLLKIRPSVVEFESETIVLG